ncbi:MAG: DMT family transporter [Candidatus Marinimicrobia bacterium]|jgi:drug/metabolite transporter (DMT)-like permease|nr:DMT family transporter [Candidatus Neomarinimicrobiota bacterium]MBT3762862.1 DMT family transporter [Candidatus Neomarinimicrobiota bacterium]MBT5174984.1 DMT family transporter [Candidatus Neomarinimicrobiota bacterium]MBT6129442.1 DMT family transporter [Candidatus Neomarinimicrobiota bacterium]
MNMKLKIYILYALMISCWGTTWYFLKISLQETPLFWGLALRFIFAGMIFWVFYFIKNERIKFTSEIKKVYFLYTFLNFTLCYFLTYWAMRYVYSNLGSILWSLFPLCVAGMAHFYLPDDKLNFRKTLSMVVGFIGTILILYKGESLGMGNVVYGIIAILISIVLAAWPNIYLKMHHTKINTFHLNAVGMTTSGIIMMLISFILEQGQSMPMDSKNLFALIYLTVPGTVVTWGIYIWLFNHMRVSQISYVAFFPPVIAIAMGWIFLGEELPMVIIIGASLIILGGFLINYQTRVREIISEPGLLSVTED